MDMHRMNGRETAQGLAPEPCARNAESGVEHEASVVAIGEGAPMGALASRPGGRYPPAPSGPASVTWRAAT
jgi:hypothetical protein